MANSRNVLRMGLKSLLRQRMSSEVVRISYVGVGCRRQSTFVQTVDQMLQFSPTNPIYMGTAGFFDVIHSSTGLPWWLSIVVTTFAIRTIVHLPLTIAAQKSQAKLIQLKPELEKEMESVASAVKHAKWVHKLTVTQYKESLKKSLDKANKTFYETHNVHPLKGTVVVLTQLPVWITLSLTLRNMTGCFGLTAYDGFSTEGASLFTDLTIGDPTLILPISLGLLTFMNMRMGRKLYPAPSSLNPQMIRIEKKSRRVMELIAPTLTLVALTQPAAISLYWVSSTLYSLLQSTVISLPAARRRLGVPVTPNEPDIFRFFRK